MWWRKPKVGFVDGRLTGTVVQGSMLKRGGFFIPMAAVSFAESAREFCHYIDRELPPELLQAYYADRYLAEVNNGGHSQFVRHSRISAAGLATTTSFALAGLEKMGARVQLQHLRNLNAWISENPEEAAAQTGHSETDSPYLASLDKQFYDVERRDSISDRSARWIKSWRNLEVVDDNSYDERLSALAALNPNYDIRHIWRGVERNRILLTHNVEASIAVVCGRVQPHPELKVSVYAGEQITFGSKEAIQYRVETDKGARLAIVHDDGVLLYERVATESGLNSVGPLLATVSAELVRQFVEFAAVASAAEAIDLIARRSGLYRNNVEYQSITAIELEGNRATWIAYFGSRKLVVTTTPDRAALLDDSGSEVLTVTKGEIADYHAEALRGRDSM